MAAAMSHDDYCEAASAKRSGEVGASGERSSPYVSSGGKQPLSKHADDVAASSPHNLEKSPGPPPVLVISDDDEELEVFEEAPSRRRAARCRSGWNRPSSAGSPIVISSEDEAVGVEEGGRMFSYRFPHHHKHAAVSGTRIRPPHCSRSRSPLQHRGRPRGRSDSGYSHGDPIVISSDSDLDVHHPRSPFKSSPRPPPHRPPDRHPPFPALSHHGSRRRPIHTRRTQPNSSPYHYPHHHHSSHPPSSPRHSPSIRLVSRQGHPDLSNSPHGADQRRISRDPPLDERVSPHKRGPTTSPYQHVSRNSYCEQHISPSRHEEDRLPPHSRGSVVYPRQPTSRSPPHWQDTHRRCRDPPQEDRVSPHPQPSRSPPRGSSSTWCHRSHVKTEYRSPEKGRHFQPWPPGNGYHSVESPTDNLPNRLPLVKQGPLVREFSCTPLPRPPPLSSESPLPPAPSTAPPPCTLTLSPHSPRPLNRGIPQESRLNLSLSLKKRRRLFTEEAETGLSLKKRRRLSTEEAETGLSRRRLFTEEAETGCKIRNIGADQGSEMSISEVDIDRRRSKSETERGGRALSETPKRKGEQSGEAKRERTLRSYDSTPEISPVQKQRKRRPSTAAMLSKGRQTQLHMYFPGRDATPPLEEHKAGSLSSVGGSQPGRAVRGATPPAVPPVVLTFPEKPSSGEARMGISGGGSGLRGSEQSPYVPVSLLSSVKHERKMNTALPSNSELLTSPCLSSSQSGTPAHLPPAARVAPGTPPPVAQVAPGTPPPAAQGTLPPAAQVAPGTPPPVAQVAPGTPPTAAQVAPGTPPTAAWPVTTIPAWSDSELEVKGESGPDSPELRVDIPGLDIGGFRAASTFAPSPKSSWNYVVVYMDTARRGRDDGRFVESLEEVANRGFCIPDSQIVAVLRHVLHVSGRDLLLRLNSVLAVDASSRSGVALPVEEVWDLLEECCRLFTSSGSPSGNPRSYPESAHVVLLYLTSLLVADAATRGGGGGGNTLVEQTLSPAPHWRRVRVVVDLFLELLVGCPPPSPLPDLPPVVARLLSVCASVSRETGSGDGVVRLARELSCRMSKLSSMQLRMELLLLVPCHSFREEIIKIHLQTKFPLSSPSLNHAPTPSDDDIILNLAAHFRRCPGRPQDLAFFLSLLFHLLHSHCSRRLLVPSASPPHPPPSPSSTFHSLSPSELALKLEQEIHQLPQRLLGEESLLSELTTSHCWFYLQLLQNMFSHITQ